MCKYCDKIYVNNEKDGFDDPDVGIIENVVTEIGLELTNDIDVVSDLSIHYEKEDNYKPYLEYTSFLRISGRGQLILQLQGKINYCPMCGRNLTE